MDIVEIYTWVLTFLGLFALFSLALMILFFAYIIHVSLF